MAQDYTSILTTENLVLPGSMPHFRVKSTLNIPIDVDRFCVKEFIESYDEGKLNPIFYEDEIIEHEEDTHKILAIVRELGLEFKAYGILHTSDWADVPDYDFHGAFINGNRVDKYISNISEEEGEYYGMFKCLDIQEDSVLYFHRFYEAVEEFEKLRK